MRFVGEAVGPGSPEAARAMLTGPGAWTWSHAQITPTPDGCTVAFEHPIPVRFRIEVVPTETGVRFRLVEGDLTEFSGSVDVQPDGSGCRVRTTLDLGFRVGVPGTLLRELDLRLLPRWLAAVAHAPEV